MSPSTLQGSDELNQEGEPRLAVTSRPISSLRPDPANPRRHSRKQVRQIADSIKLFGFNVPILADDRGNVMAGHGRLLAAQSLGMTQVPVIRVAHLTPAQQRAFMIADNRLTEVSAWDDRLLAEQFKALSLLDLDFSLEVTGFDMGDIDLRIETLQPPPPADDPADEIPAVAGPTVTRPGDLWQLGDHRLLCGNALEAASYEILLQDEPAAMVFADPPYNVPIDGHTGGLGAIHHRPFAMASGEMSPAAFTTFLTQALSLIARHSRDGSLHYICMDWRHIEELTAAGRAAYTELKNLCVWTKDNAGMGSLYRSQHELVFVFRKGDAAHRNNIQLGRFGRNRTNVWPYPGINSLSRAGGEGNLLALHPTVKPVALVRDAILDCTERGDIVLDPFLGSGTTLIAAERVGRRCHGIEIDPVYCDTIIRRWQTLTGKQARRVADGQAFATLAQPEVPHVERV